MSERLHVLIVEDNPADVDLMRDALSETGPIGFHSESVPRLSEALARLATGGINLVVTDLGLPDSQGLATFRKLRQAAPDLAIIVATGNDDQEMAVAAVREGAQDYLVKGQINGDLLVRSVRYATERKRAEEALKQINQELKETNQALKDSSYAAEAANRAKSEFLANMSHEIRTPMTAILGYTELMSDEDIGHAIQAHIEVIQRNGKHLLGLINDILDLSKIEAEKLQIEPTRGSLRELVTEVVSLMRVRADAKHLKLETDLAGPLPETILTDPLRLRQILVNLLGNAIKFTEQGEVCLVVRMVPGKGTVPFSSDENREGDSPIFVGRKSGQSPDLRLCFDVTDTGIGMNEEQIGKLFKPFSQVDNSATRKYGGTGLGLCISKRLSEALGGNIEVRSEPGKGSTFSVTIDPGPLDGIRMIQNAQEAHKDLVDGWGRHSCLPMADKNVCPTGQPNVCPTGQPNVCPTGQSPTPTAATPEKIVLHGRILLAEDGEDNQRMICFILRKAGAEVVAVENGQLALDAVLAANETGQPFDLILMDMQMPVLNGYEATRQLREQGYIGPIIALTAHSMVMDQLKCFTAGCDDYQPKPFQHQDLLNMVARHITAKKEEDQPIHSPLAADPDCHRVRSGKPQADEAVAR